MTDEFNPERARKETIEAIDRVAMTVIANRQDLARAIIAKHPEASTPAMGPAAVNMALNILAILRDRVENVDDLADASNVPPPDERH